MAQQPENLLSEYGQVLSGHAALLTYQMSHFCVKADPMALLSIEIVHDGSTMNIENLCQLSLIDDYTYGFIPENEALVPEIVKAVMHEHPELEIGYLMCKDEEVYPLSEELENDPDYVKIISAHVPDVDSDRRKGILNGIKVLYERCRSVYEKCKADYGKRMVPMLANEDPSTIKQYTDKLDEIGKEYAEIRDQMYEAKQQEVEDAYKEYQANHEAAKAQELEDAKAKGLDVVQGFNMFDNIDQ